MPLNWLNKKFKKDNHDSKGPSLARALAFEHGKARQDQATSDGYGHLRGNHALQERDRVCKNYKDASCCSKPQRPKQHTENSRPKLHEVLNLFNLCRLRFDDPVDLVLEFLRKLLNVILYILRFVFAE